jgi:hypothetical protein
MDHLVVSCGAVVIGSLLPQGDHGVDPQGLAQRRQMRHEGDATQQQNRRRERRGIHRADAEDQRPEVPRRNDGRGEAGSKTEQQKNGAAREHHPNHVSATSTERDPDTELAGALRHGVRDDAVQPEGGKQDGNAGKS